jgi:hypothetical protein
MTKYVITVEEDARTGIISVTSEGPENDRTATKLMFDLILNAVKGAFKPTRTWFRPRKWKKK